MFGGAVILGAPDTAEAHARKALTQLIRVGGRLAVLGVQDGARAMGAWHVARPGSWSVPQGGPEGGDLTYAKAMCGRTIVTNGYSADWRPPAGLLCPACAEQL